MAATNPGFEVVGGTEAEPKAEASAIHIRMLQLALASLSQRALIALMDLFCLITCAGAWFLWWVTPNPTTLQIIHNSIFAAFILAANWIVRRKA